MRFSFVRNLQRQHWLRIIGLVALLFSSLIVTTNGIRAHDGEDHGTPAAQAESHQGHDARECEPTTEQQAAADQLIADTAGALSAYPSPESAEAAGYRLWGRQDPEHGDSPNGTWHYVNWEYKRDDAALDPSKIETIMYGRTPDGGVQVIGGMYLMPRGEEGPRPGGCLTTWHTHTLGDFTTPEMMHVYTVDLSVGPFAHQGSPYYACEVLGQIGVGSGYMVAPPDCEPRPFDRTGRLKLVSDIAAFLGLTPEELQQEILSGESHASLTENTGITREELKEFLPSTVEQHLDQAVGRGEMTENQANVILQRFDRFVDRLIDHEGPWRDQVDPEPVPSPAA